MQTPTLTEARRALLEISQPEYAAYLTEQIALRLAVVGAYLDAQVPLEAARQNVHEFLRAGLPTMADIVASADGKSADGMTLHFRTKEKYEAAALAMHDVRNRELDDLKGYKPPSNIVLCSSDRNALKPNFGNRRFFVVDNGLSNQPGINDIVSFGEKFEGKDVISIDLTKQGSDRTVIGKVENVTSDQKGNLAADLVIKPGCGKCFKCLHHGIGKFMAKADPDNLCDGGNDD